MQCAAHQQTAFHLLQLFMVWLIPFVILSGIPSCICWKSWIILPLFQVQNAVWWPFPLTFCIIVFSSCAIECRIIIVNDDDELLSVLSFASGHWPPHEPGVCLLHTRKHHQLREHDGCRVAAEIQIEVRPSCFYLCRFPILPKLLFE